VEIPWNYPKQRTTREE